MTNEQIVFAKQEYMKDLNRIKTELRSMILTKADSIDKDAIRKKLDQLAKETRYGNKAEYLKEEKIVTDADLVGQGAQVMQQAIDSVKERVKSTNRKDELNKMLDDYKKNSELFKIEAALKTYGKKEFDLDGYKKIKEEKNAEIKEEVKETETSKNTKESVYNPIKTTLLEINKKEKQMKDATEVLKAHREYKDSVNAGKADKDKENQSKKLLSEYLSIYDISFDKTKFNMEKEFSSIINDKLNEIELDLVSVADCIVNNPKDTKDLSTNKYKIQIERCLIPNKKPIEVIDKDANGITGYEKLKKVLENAEKELGNSIKSDEKDIMTKKEQNKVLSKTVETIEKENVRLTQEKEIEEELEKEGKLKSREEKDTEIEDAITEEYENKGLWNKFQQRREALGINGSAFKAIRHPFKTIGAMFGYGQSYVRKQITIDKEESLDKENRRIADENLAIRRRNYETRQKNNETRQRNDELDTDKLNIMTRRETMSKNYHEELEKGILNSHGNVNDDVVKKAYEKADRKKSSDDGR